MHMCVYMWAGWGRGEVVTKAEAGILHAFCLAAHTCEHGDGCGLGLYCNLQLQC